MTQPIYADRRKASRLPSSFWQGLLLAAAIAALAWAAKPLIPVTEKRFEADSVSRDRSELRRDSVLNRIDSRVGEMWCGRIPDSLRAGCR